MDKEQECCICGRKRRKDERLDYNPMQVVFGDPLGWYESNDGIICPEDMEKTMRGQG